MSAGQTPGTAALAARVRAGMDYGSAPALAALDVLVERLAAAEEAFRVIAQGAGSDGCDPDDWRANTMKRESALWAVGELRSDYDEALAEIAAAEQDNERLRGRIAVIREGMQRQQRATEQRSERAVLGSRPHQEPPA